MSIITKVKAVEKLFDNLQIELSAFQEVSTLYCKIGCGKCCNKADINASPLEFLPWAFHIFLAGQAESTLENLNQETSGLCFLLKPLSINNKTTGQCSEYKYRGLICRLFGFAAVRDKFSQLKIATCKIIKEEQSIAFNSTQNALSKGLSIPVFSDYYMKLARIDFVMGNKNMPINEAMRSALEEVLHYYAYRPYPKIQKNIA